MDDSRFEIITSLAQGAPPLPHSWSDAELDELQSTSIADALRQHIFLPLLLLLLLCLSKLYITIT